MLKKVLKQKRRLNEHSRLPWADARLSTRTSLSFSTSSNLEFKILSCLTFNDEDSDFVVASLSFSTSSNLEFKILSCLTFNDEDSDFVVATLDALVRVERSWQVICSLLDPGGQELDIVLIVCINFGEGNCF
jgi:hypothetical protein